MMTHDVGELIAEAIKECGSRCGQTATFDHFAGLLKKQLDLYTDAIRRLEAVERANAAETAVGPAWNPESGENKAEPDPKAKAKQK